MSFWVLNQRTYSCRNYAARGTGWQLSDSGVPELLTGVGAYEDFDVNANLQALSGRKRKQEGHGSETSDRVCLIVAPDADGVFPAVRTAEHSTGLLATRITYNSGTYEVDVVKKDWTHGLVPYLYVEAERLTVQLDPGPLTTSDKQW